MPGTAPGSRQHVRCGWSRGWGSSEEGEAGSLEGPPAPLQMGSSTRAGTQHLFPEYHVDTMTISSYRRGKPRPVKIKQLAKMVKGKPQESRLGPRQARRLLRPHA